MKLGEIGKYKVLRETDLGYMLVALEDSENEDAEEIFLHRNETNFKKLYPGDIVSAFLYLDKQKRVAATLYEPLITINQGALCKVVNKTTAGAFFDIGISKDILMSSDEYSYTTAPHVGDFLPVKLRIKASGLYIKLLNKEEMLEKNDGFRYAEGESTNAYVYRITKDGINLVDEHFNIFFIHKNNLRNEHHLGENLSFKIIGVKENGNYFDYYGSTIKQKEEMLESDCETVLNYLKEHHGVMTYTEDSDPLVIDRVFHMSKVAYKRALGHLYKEEKILLLNNKIVLKR